ncbi:carboxylesterase family protein [Aureliella helgolandensis]|uniref:Phospholipase/Carboxylesterase n=1 Tax=Aureliella helgolandensis TaxID=2527968 RepID=A0A518GEW7_9BACT|nr:prolyl oligopeptidase family serine peptidase [Aureliella helgolandensis]QDV27141.1 Phospholipase/Carboxylesterase [Aureliella helgolandensis]
MLRSILRTFLPFSTCFGIVLCTAPVASAQTTKVDAAETAPEKLFEPREYIGEEGPLAGKSLKYRLLKPLDYDPGEKYPLVVFLHGAGERGDDNTAQLVHGMADFCSPENRKKYRCYVIAPQCPKGEKWADIDWSADQVALPPHASQSMQLTLALVDSMLADAAVDKKRVYITGLSMGGYGTWDALARRPDFFAAAIPICGGGDPATAEQIKHIPLACYHGGADSVVNVELSRDMIEALRQAGGKPLYTEYPGVGHNSWTATYANPDTLEWLFAQRRTAKVQP